MAVSQNAFEGAEELDSLPKKKGSKPVAKSNDPFAGAEELGVVKNVKPVTLKSVQPQQSATQSQQTTTATPAPQQQAGQPLPSQKDVFSFMNKAASYGKKPMQSVVNGTDPDQDAQKMEETRKAISQYIKAGGNPVMDIYGKALKAGKSEAESEELLPAQREMTQATAKAEVDANKQFVVNFLKDNSKDLENMIILNNRPNSASTEVNHGEPFVQPGMADIGLSKAAQGNGTGPAVSTLGQNLSSTGIFSKDNFASRLLDPTGDPRATTQFRAGALDVLQSKQAKEESEYIAQHSAEVDGGLEYLPFSERKAAREQLLSQGLDEIRAKYDDQRKNLTRALGNIAGIKSVNRRVREKGSDAPMDPIEIGMEVRGQLGGGAKVDKDIARIKAGKKLDPDDAVSYALEGYRAMQTAMMENYGNDRLAIVQNLAEQAKDYQKKILDDNPEFKRRQAIRAISSKLYDNSSAIGAAIGSIPTPSGSIDLLEVSDEDVQRVGREMGLPEELMHGINANDIQNPQVWYKRAAGKFIGEGAGGLYKLLLRGAGVANDALGGHTDWDFANEYLGEHWYENTDVPFIGGKQLLGGTPEDKGLFGSPTVVETNPLSKDYLFNKENPNAGKFRWDFRAIINQAGESAGSLAALVTDAGAFGKLYEAGSMLRKGGQGVAMFAEGTAEAAAAAKRLDRIALTGSTMLTGYADSYSQAVTTFPGLDGEEGLEAKRNLYAMLKTGMSALAMQILPNTKVGQDLLHPGTPIGDDLVSYVARNGVSNVDMPGLYRIGGAFVKKLSDYGHAVSIGNVDQLGQGMIDALVAPKKYETSDQWEIQKQTAISGMIGMALPVLGRPIAHAAFENKMQRAMLWEAGSNPQPIIDQITTMVKDGKMDPNEGNQRIAAVNTMADIVDKHTPLVSPENGLPLTPDQQQIYAQKFLVETMLSKQAETTGDEVAKKAIEKRINQLRKERGDILEQAGNRQIRDKVARAAEARKNSSSSQNQNQNGNEKTSQESGQEAQEGNQKEGSGLPGQGQGRDVNSGEASAGEKSPADLYKEFVNEDEDGNEIAPEGEVEPTKTETNATKEGDQPAQQEGSPEGGVREHTPVDVGQQEQAQVAEATPQSDSGDSPVSSERGQEGAKEKVDERLPKYIIGSTAPLDRDMYEAELNKPGSQYDLYRGVFGDLQDNGGGKRDSELYKNDPLKFIEEQVERTKGNIAYGEANGKMADPGYSRLPEHLQKLEAEVDRIKDLQARLQPEQPAVVEPVAVKEEANAPRDVREIFNTRKPIAEDSPEIRAQIDRINQNSETIAKLDELAKNTADEEQRANINARSLRLGEENNGLENEVVNSRREVKDSLPIVQEARKAKAEGQSALNKLKKDHVGTDGDVNEWKKGMAVSEQEFNDFQDAVKRLSVRQTEVTSNEELQKDIDSVNETLKKLSVKGNTEIHSPAAGETIESQELKARVEDQKLRTGDAVKRRENGSYIDREGNTYTRNPELTDAPTGKEGAVRFTHDETEPFAFQLLEAKDLQPSHMNGRINPRFFIPEAQPKDRRDDTSKAASESIANSPDLGRLGDMDNAYFGAPVVNSRGEVIQGNNRSEALKKHYEKGMDSYKDQLINDAEKFGFTPEQVDGMKEPVLVRKVAADDNRAIELGQYDVKDLETGGNRRIDPVTTSRRIPYEKKMQIAKAVIGDGEEDISLKVAIRKNYKRAINLIKDYITPTQYQTLNNGTSVDGISDIEKLITHFLFEGGDNSLPVLFDSMDAMIKKNILNSLPEIFGPSPEASLIPDIQQVIIANGDFEASKTGRLSAWFQQPDMILGNTPLGRYTPLEIKLLQMLHAEDNARPTNEIQTKLRKYGELVRGKGKDLLGPAEPGMPKAEAIRQTFDVPYNDVHENQEAQEAQPRISRSSEGGGITPDAQEVHPGEQQPAGDAIDRPAAAEPAAGEQPAAVEKVIDPKKVEKELKPKEKKVVEKHPEELKALDDKVEALDLPEEQAEVINNFINKNSDENGNLDWEKVDAVIGGAGDDPVKITEAIVKNDERQKENDDNAAAGEGVPGDSRPEGDSEQGDRPVRENLPPSRSDVGGNAGDKQRLTTVGANLIPAVRDRIPDGLKEHLAPHQQQGVNLALDTFEKGKKAFLLADGPGSGKTRGIIAFAELSPEPVTIVTENPAIINGSFKDDAKSMGLSFVSKKEGTLIGKHATIVTKEQFRSGKYPKTNRLVFDESQNASGLDSVTYKALQDFKGKVLYASATPFDNMQKSLYVVPRLLGISEKQYLDEIGGKIIERPGRGRELQINDGPDLIHYLVDAHRQLVADGQLVSRYYPFYGNDRGSIELKNDVIDDIGKLTTVDEEGKPVVNTHPNASAVLNSMSLSDAEGGISAFYDRRIKIAQRMGPTDEELKKGLTTDEKVRQLREQKNNELRRLSETYKATHELALTIKRDLGEGKQVVIYSPNIKEAMTFNYSEAMEEGADEGGAVGNFAYTRPSFFRQIGGLLQKEGIPFESLNSENKDKARTVANFQDGKTKVLVINQTGTTGINLNDTKGDAPRIMYVVGNPPNAIQYDQLKGRISRLNNASKAEVVKVENGGQGDFLARQKQEEKAGVMNAFVKGEMPNGHPDKDAIDMQAAEAPRIEELNDKQFVVVNTRTIRAKMEELGGNHRKDKNGWAFPNAKRAKVEEFLKQHEAVQGPAMEEGVRHTASAPRIEEVKAENEAAHQQLTPNEQEAVQRPEVKKAIEKANEAIDKVEITPEQEAAIERLAEGDIDEHVARLKDEIDLNLPPEQIAQEVLKKLTNEGSKEPGLAERPAAVANEGEIRSGQPEQDAKEQGLPQGVNAEADIAGNNAADRGGDPREQQAVAAGNQEPNGGQSQPSNGPIAKPEKTGDPLTDAVNEHNYWQAVVEKKKRAIELAVDSEINNPDGDRYRGSAKWELDQVSLKQAQVRQRQAEVEANKQQKADRSKAPYLGSEQWQNDQQDLKSAENNARKAQIEETKQKGIKIADKIRKAKIKGGDKLLTTPAQIPVALWNAAVETVALAVEAGAHINAAVQTGVDYVNNHHFTQWDEKEFRKQLGEGQAIPPTAAELRGKKDDGVKLHPTNRATADALLDKIRNNQETLFGALHNIDGVRHLSAGVKAKIKSYIRDYANAEIFKSTGDQWADKHLQNNNYDFKAAMRDLVDDVHMQLLGAADDVERENINKKYAAAKTVIESQETSHLVETGQITPKYKKDPGPDPTFDLPAPTWKNPFKVDRSNFWSTVKENAQHAKQVLKENLFDQKSRLVEAQKLSNTVITDANDAIVAMTLAPGQAHYAVKEVQKYLGNGASKEGSLFDRWKHDGVDIRRMGLFLYAEHAPEANAKIAKNRKEIFDRKLYELNDRLATEKDPTKAGKLQTQIDEMLRQDNPAYPLMPDGGSGMSNQQAKDLMKEFHDEGTHDLYQKYADEFRENVVNKILEWKHDTGLIDDTMYNTLHPANGFKKYVPLKVDLEGEELTPDARKNSYAQIKDSGRDIYRRYGSVERGYDERNNPALQSIHDLETSIRMGEANKAHNVLAQLVRENPNPAIWEIRDAQHEVLNDAAGNVIKATEINRPTAPAIEFRENGKKKYIIMHDPGLQKLTKAIGMNGVARVFNKATQIVRATNTLYNPDFIVKNPLMDYGDAWLNLVPEENKEILKNFQRYAASAGKVALQLAFGGEHAEWKTWEDRAEKAGGMITFTKNMDITESAKKTMKLYEKYHDPLGAARIKHAFRAVENVTSALEKMTRTVVFRSAIEAGESDSKAAMLSRNATVDFEKKGYYGAWINAFKAFANASIQGLANLSYSAMKSKKVRGFLMSMVGAGFAEAAMNDALGDCKDAKRADCWWEVPEYRKMRNFTIPTGGHTPVSLPLPRQFAWFNYLGKNLYALTQGQMDGGQFLSNSVSSLFDFYNPAGGSAPMSQQILGNLAPMAGIGSNQNSFGGPIFPDNKNQPNHQDMWEHNTPVPYQHMATFLSEISGGKEKEGRAGKIEISPNELEYVVQNTFGGVYGSLRNLTFSGPKDMADPKTGHHWENKHIPIVRVFSSESDMAGTKERYYKLAKFAEENLLNENEHKHLNDYTEELVKSGQWTEEQRGKALKYVQMQQSAVRRNVEKHLPPGSTSGGGAKGGWK